MVYVKRPPVTFDPMTQMPPASLPPYNPLSITWAAAYWAEDPSWTNPGNGNAVSSWRDGSGNSRDATQATGANQPLYRSSDSGLNSMPTVDFDGTNDYLATAGFTIAQPATRVIVVRMKSVVASRHFFSTNGAGQRNDMNSDSGPITWVMYAGTQLISATVCTTVGAFLIAEYNGVSSSLSLNGSSIASGDAGGQSSGDISLGTFNGGAGTSCHIAFAALKSGLLTAQNKADLLAWSRLHYATP